MEGGVLEKKTLLRLGGMAAVDGSPGGSLNGQKLLHGGNVET